MQCATLKDAFESKSEAKEVTEQETQLQATLKQHFALVANRSNDEERKHNLTMFQEMSFSAVLNSKAENVFFDTNASEPASLEIIQQVTQLEYLQALLSKIEEKILSSPALQQNLVLDKLFGGEQSAPC